ncbi:hypothetical protein IMCC14465_15970 [alpha proteobacterium IMCC14465]|uniref:Uncharacterized protein n=1 Tax=alpha proteobacterium IMCC14465 TaxID=1220535 RepID=J9A301_9PROT|nr:hypothetical protein IMCC14465_15970 [alpha proteobacterium IMCC14465]
MKIIDNLSPNFFCNFTGLPLVASSISAAEIIKSMMQFLYFQNAMKTKRNKRND